MEIFYTNSPEYTAVIIYSEHKSNLYPKKTTDLSIKNRRGKPAKHFVRLSGSYSLDARPNGQPVALPTLMSLRDAHAQTALKQLCGYWWRPNWPGIIHSTRISDSPSPCAPRPPRGRACEILTCKLATRTQYHAPICLYGQPPAAITQ